MIVPTDQYLDQLTDLDAEDLQAHQRSVTASLANVRKTSQPFIDQLEYLRQTTQRRLTAEKHYAILEARYLSSSPEEQSTLETQLFNARDNRDNARTVESQARAKVWHGQKEAA